MIKNYFKIIWKKLESSLTIVSIILSIIIAIIQMLDICSYKQILLCCLLVIITVIIYLIIIIVKNILYNKTKKITINFGDSKVNVFYGDIFSDENKGYKVIAFNEYFDTITDENLNIIDKDSLHGRYLDKYYPDDDSREQFHNRVVNELKSFLKDKNKMRKIGYKEFYELGTLFKDNDYLLMSFTKFDKYNRAHIKYSEMVTSFINMWFNIDTVKGNKKVYLPLIGSGITRFDDGEVTDKEILFSLIDTFKISRVKFKYPADVNIVLYKENQDIDLVLIKEKYNE